MEVKSEVLPLIMGETTQLVVLFHPYPEIQILYAMRSIARGDPIAHIKAFEMKLKLKFGMNDNIMAKYLPTIFQGDAVNWYLLIPTKSIN